MKTPLMTVAEVATYLRVSTKKVLALLKAGRLRGGRVDVGTRSPWRISERDLDDYVALQRQVAHAPSVRAAVESAFDADRYLGPEAERFL